MSPSTITANNNNFDISTNYSTSPPQPVPPVSVSAPTPSSNPTLQHNALKTFTTARSLIHTVLDIDSRSKFIAHCPGVLCRALTDAANTIVYLLHSTWGPSPDSLSAEEADLLAQQAYTSIMRCSVKEQDIWYRGSVIMETFWSFRRYVPRFDTVPPSWVSRGGAGITFACLEKFKNGLLTAQKSTDGVNKCLEIIRKFYSAAYSTSNLPFFLTISEFRTDPSSGTNTTAQDQQMTNNAPVADPFQDVDWSMFMDDFGWTTGEDGVLIGLI